MSDSERATGRTIRLMLKIILAMSEQPGEWIEVVNEYPKREAHLHMMQWIKDVCAVLHMQLEWKLTVDRIYLRFIKPARND